MMDLPSPNIFLCMFIRSRQAKGFAVHDGCELWQSKEACRCSQQRGSMYTAKTTSKPCGRGNGRDVEWASSRKIIPWNSTINYPRPLILKLLNSVGTRYSGGGSLPLPQQTHRKYCRKEEPELGMFIWQLACDVADRTWVQNLFLP